METLRQPRRSIRSSFAIEHKGKRLEHLTRRSFLKLAGIAVLAHQLPGVHLPLDDAPELDFVYGRALTTVDVYAQPDRSAPQTASLWQHSVTPIHDRAGGWYRVDLGWIERRSVQPILSLPTYSAPVAAPPFLAEVAGASAAIRAWCGADAPLKTTLGHGAVLRVVDRLQIDELDWYGVAGDDGALAGWTQAAAWSPVTPPDFGVSGGWLHVDSRTHTLEAAYGGRTVLRAPVALGDGVTPGQYHVRRKEACQACTADGGVRGIPWQTGLDGGITLSGAYWHNDFGATIPGNSLEVPPPVAKWLYGWLADGANIICS